MTPKRNAVTAVLNEAEPVTTGDFGQIRLERKDILEATGHTALDLELSDHRRAHALLGCCCGLVVPSALLACESWSLAAWFLATSVVCASNSAFLHLLLAVDAATGHPNALSDDEDYGDAWIAIPPFLGATAIMLVFFETSHPVALIGSLLPGLFVAGLLVRGLRSGMGLGPLEGLLSQIRAYNDSVDSAAMLSSLEAPSASAFGLSARASLEGRRESLLGRLRVAAASRRNTRLLERTRPLRRVIGLAPRDPELAIEEMKAVLEAAALDDVTGEH